MSARTATAPAAAARSRAQQLVADYVELTKPKVQSLLLFTTVATMEGAGNPSAGRIALTWTGGAAAACPPLFAWAAPRGSLSWTAVYLFAIVFYSTPPHFWALSLLMKDDYAKVGVRMLPVARGEALTR